MKAPDSGLMTMYDMAGVRPDGANIGAARTASYTRTRVCGCVAMVATV